MAERTPEQLFYEDGLTLREIARKAGVPDDKGAVLILLNPKTNQKEKHILGEFIIKAPEEEGKPKDKKAPDVKPKKEPSRYDIPKEKEGMTHEQHYDKIKKLTKSEQMKILKDFGLSWLQRKQLRYEDQRIRKIIELQQ